MRIKSLAAPCLLALAIAPAAHAADADTTGDTASTAAPNVQCDERPKPRSARDMHTARYPRGRIITRAALDRTSDVNLAGAIAKASNTAHFGHQGVSHDELLTCYADSQEG